MKTQLLQNPNKRYRHDRQTTDGQTTTYSVEFTFSKNDEQKQFSYTKENNECLEFLIVN